MGYAGEVFAFRGKTHLLILSRAPEKDPIATGEKNRGNGEEKRTATPEVSTQTVFMLLFNMQCVAEQGASSIRYAHDKLGSHKTDVYPRDFALMGHICCCKGRERHARGVE